MLLAVSMTAAMAAGSISTVYAGGDTLPARPGEAGYKGENQPTMHGYSVQDLLNWSPETDQYAKFMRAQIPQQEKIAPFAQTQANPLLVEDVKSLQLTSDYGNGFFDAYSYNDQFSDYCFNFWQYVDYTASWHGMVTESTPNDLFNPEAGWWERDYQFGIINLPNPAYTNAAHKNGSQSLGCIFFPRDEHTQLYVYKDEEGNFPIADKLIEIANYYGFDGYFINAEERLPANFMPLYDEFVSYLTANGMYIQVYASNPYGQNNQGSWGGIDYYNKDATVFSNWVKKPGSPQGASSLYMNPDPSKSHVNGSVSIMESLGLDARNTVFNTLEAGQTGFSGTRGSLYNTYDENLVPRTGIASLGASMVYTGLDEQLFGHSGNNSYNEYKRGDPDYQKYVFARERTFWSGAPDAPMYNNVNANEELLGKVVNATADPVATSNDPDRGGIVAGKPYFRGMSAFITERSVVGGSTFTTNFNTGHGMQYFVDGQVSNDNQWANINIQDILPSWQWWIDTEGTRLHAEFDYGEKYNKNQLQNYTQVGGYQGGSSLVVNGKLDAENTLRLYKTDLSVKDSTKISVTYNKPCADDGSKMELAVIFKNEPNTVVTFNVPGSGKQTDGWVTKQISLGDYAGEEIAMLGLTFDPGKNDIENYQMNIGELKVMDGQSYTPDKPTGFTIEQAFDSTETYLSWDMEDFDKVKQYNVSAVLSDGSEVALGGIYDNVYYVKSLYGEQGEVTFKLTAVGKDGSESEPATLTYNFGDKVRNVEVTENAGYLDVSWDNPANADYDSLSLDVSFNYSTKPETYALSVDKDATSARMIVPVADGSEYTLTLSTVKNGVKGEAIAKSGKLKDLYSMPYSGTAVENGSGYSSPITMSPPKNSDWWHMYLYKNGRLTKTVVRGKDGMPSANEANGCTVIMEDFAGNLSEPTVFYKDAPQDGEITRAMIPDEALYNAVINQAGNTVAKAAAFTGTLDLSGSDVKDLTGISLLSSMTGLNLSGCAGLEEIKAGVFDSAAQLKEIDITGCSALKSVTINNTSLETLVYDDVESFPNLLILNLSGNRLDMSEGTPERALADQVDQQAQEYDGPLFTESQPGNLALNGVITDDTIDDWSTNFVAPGNMIDGDRNSECSAGNPIAGSPTGGAYITVDLGAPSEITSWAAYLGGSNGANCIPSKFSLLYSNDNVNFETLDTITGKSAEVIKTLDAPVTARYWKFLVQEGSSWSSIITELELYGNVNVEKTLGAEYGSQRPLLYPNVEEKLYFDVNKNGKTMDLNEYYQECMDTTVSVRGTLKEELKNASFIANGYDWDSALVSKDVHQILVTDKNGNVWMDTIETNQDGVYTVQYITYDSADYHGEVMFTQTVYVRAITSVLEAVIANAEQMIADNALENTMEAVVTEFYAALEAAREMVNKDGATQEEINAATVRLLSVMAKVDWKQGDKTILEIAIQVAETIEPNLDKYVDSCVGPFTEALANARALMESGNAWDDDIQAATTALVEAMSNMKMKPDKNALNELIASAKTMDLSKYTADSADALRSALAAAEAMAENQAATQDQVDAAANTLKAALDGLTVKNGGNGNAPSDDNNGTTAPVGDGSAPTKTGDSMNAAGLAALALLSAAAVAVLKKRKIR